MTKDLGVAAGAAPLMPNTQLLLQLAQRCEREEPSRALDAAIENAIAGGSASDLAYILTDVETATRPPAYTGSIDAAVTLVPKGLAWSAGSDTRGDASVDRWGVLSEQGIAKTAALALCAAALRARATEA